MEALRAATIHGAEYIGMGQDLGSVEVGKLADLIILEKDPMDDIQNSQYVSHTIANGRLYDVSTMNETGNYSQPRTRFYWELEGYNDNFDWHDEVHGFNRPSCICRH